MERKILYIINPISGSDRKRPPQQTIANKTRAADIPFQIIVAEKDGAYKLLSQKITRENFSDVVVCGGDGTFNKVAAALLGLNIRLGILPAGSGNGLAYSAKIPRQLTRALMVVFQGNATPIDAFYVNEHFSCMLCGIGFDAQVAHDFAEDKNRGLSTYVKQSVKNFFKASPYPFSITESAKTFSTNAFFISIANSNQFGNNFTIAPQADLNDGLLDIIVVKKMNKLKLVWKVLRQIKTGIVKDIQDKNFHEAEILYFQTNELHIHNGSSAPLHIDGDPVEPATEINIRIVPSAINLIRPI